MRLLTLRITKVSSFHLSILNPFQAHDNSDCLKSICKKEGGHEDVHWLMENSQTGIEVIPLLNIMLRKASQIIRLGVELGNIPRSPRPQTEWQAVRVSQPRLLSVKDNMRQNGHEIQWLKDLQSSLWSRPYSGKWREGALEATLNSPQENIEACLEAFDQRLMWGELSDRFFISYTHALRTPAMCMTVLVKTSRRRPFQISSAKNPLGTVI